MMGSAGMGAFRNAPPGFTRPPIHSWWRKSAEMGNLLPGNIARWIEELAGVGLIFLAMADVFMTALYVRAGTGPLSHRLVRVSWAIVRRASRLLPVQWRIGFLSFFGPVFVVGLTMLWIGLLLFGFALITLPNLGRGIRSQNGPTPTDLTTAFYSAGTSTSTVGSNELGPVSGGFKILTVLSSLLGASVLTLSITYIIQIYTALQRRNSLCLGLHYASAGTGDAAVLLAGLGAGNNFTASAGQLAGFASQVTTNYESHHFYPVLIYFCFREPLYAVARAALITLEMVSLIDAALEEERHGWLKRSAVVIQTREAAMHLLTEFAEIYLPDLPSAPGEQDESTTIHWRARYRAALGFLRGSGMFLIKDEQRGEDRYVELRRKWDSYIVGFAHYLERPVEEIDFAGKNPSETAQHRELPTPAFPEPL